MLAMYLPKRFLKFILITVLAVTPTFSSCGLIGSADAGPEVDATVTIEINAPHDQYGWETPYVAPKQYVFTASKRDSVVLRIVANAPTGKCFDYKVAVKQMGPGTAEKRDVQYLAGSRKASSMCEYYPKEADFIVRLASGEYQVLFNGKDYDVGIRVV